MKVSFDLKYIWK